ncbi:MAG: sigma-70 family RNA polymerase sigma factor [Bacteroidales bacterium]
MDLEEFRNQVLPFKDRLYRLAGRMLNHHEEAMDVTQDVMIKLWNLRDDLDNYRNLEAFAMVMTKNMCLDRLKSKRWQEISLKQEMVPGFMSSPEAQSEMSDTIRFINKLVNRLPEKQKIIMQLRDIEQLEYEAIAEITGLSLNNIRVILSRARKKVRDELIKVNSYEFSKN